MDPNGFIHPYIVLYNARIKPGFFIQYTVPEPHNKKSVLTSSQHTKFVTQSYSIIKK
jgi:hypothetical protein